MSKFTCLALCVVAAILSSVQATKAVQPTLRDAWRKELDACSKEYPVTSEQVDEGIESGDTSNYHPCYNYCVLQKVGFYKDNGEYDLENGFAELRKDVKDDLEYAKLVEVVKVCTSGENTPRDETARCASGNILSLCLLLYKDTISY